MGSTYSIDRPRGLVRSVGWGIITAAEVRAHDRRLLDDPAFREDYEQLIDLRRVDRYDGTRAALRDAANAALFRPGTRRAIVAAGDATFGLSRMLASYAEERGQLIRVFRVLSDALGWLGIDSLDDAPPAPHLSVATVTPMYGDVVEQVES